MKKVLFALLLISGSAAAQQSGFMYKPAVIDSQNVGTITFDSAHVIRSDNQVIISGRFAVAWNFTGQRNRIVISVPIPSDFTTGAALLTGQMSVHDNGFHDPEGGLIIPMVGAVMFEWWARINTVSIVDYYFVYTIKN